MHWLARVFASAVARRIAYLFVALILAWLGIGNASAQSFQSEGEAWSVCRSELAAYIAGRTAWEHQNVRCRVLGNVSAKRIRSDFDYRRKGSSDAWLSGFYREYTFKDGCSVADSFTGTGPWSSIGGSARTGSLGCHKGCDGQWDKNVDSTYTWTSIGSVCPEDPKNNCEHMGGGYFWNALLGICEPPNDKCVDGKPPNSLGQCGPEPCPSGMTLQADGTCKKKDNECPAGTVRSPDGKCLPGEGQCAKGEVRGPDGTCKKDRDEDGEPDPQGEDEPNSFSGGDDCGTPPSCSGDAIMCGQARIQWRIDCNTRRNTNIAGGHCSAMPVCTGEKCDAMEHTQMIMQWRTACAVEKLAQGTGGGGDGNGDLAAIRDALTGTGGTVDPGASQPGSGAWMPDTPDGGGGVGQPDTAGYGWGGGSCPAPPAIEIMGSVIEFDVTPLCNWLSLASYFVMGLAALGSLRIVATRDA